MCSGYWRQFAKLSTQSNTVYIVIFDFADFTACKFVECKFSFSVKKTMYSNG